MPDGMSQKQFQAVNINFLVEGKKRIRKKRKKPKVVYGKKILKHGMNSVQNDFGLPLFNFTPNFNVSVGNQEKQALMELDKEKTIIDLTKRIQLLKVFCKNQFKYIYNTKLNISGFNTVE